MQNVASSVLGRCCALASSRLELPNAGFLQFSAYQHRKFSGLQGKEEHRGAGINREHGVWADCDAGNGITRISALLNLLVLVNGFQLWRPCQGGLFICIRTENHAISDGWSNPLMLQEAIQFYTGACCFAHQGMVLGSKKWGYSETGGDMRLTDPAPRFAVYADHVLRASQARRYGNHASKTSLTSLSRKHVPGFAW